MYKKLRSTYAVIALIVCIAAAGLAAGAYFGAPDQSGSHQTSAAHQEAADRTPQARPDDVQDPEAVVHDAKAGSAEDPYAAMERKLAERTGTADYDGYIVKLKDQTPEKTIRRLDRAIREGAHLNRLQYTKNTYTADSLEAVGENIADSDIDYIEPDYQVQMLEEEEPPAGGEPLCNDSLYSKQYGLEQLHMPSVWEYGMEGQDFDHRTDMDYDGTGDNDPIVVAVVDSGLKQEHEDIDWDRVVPGRSFAENTVYSDTEDILGHGTSVAGLIAAKKNNQKGIAGLLQEVQVMPIRVFSTKGKAEESVIAEALNYVTDQKIQYQQSGGTSGVDVSVINMSLGGDTADETMEAACKRAINAGMLLVAAAGNNGNTTACYPAQYCMGVGSVNSKQTVSSFSQRLAEKNGAGYAEKLWVVAPGEGIWTLAAGNVSAYREISGTSFSCPMVAALGALCKSLNNDMDQKGFMTLLKNTAIPKAGSKGKIGGQDVEYGWGLVDFRRTLNTLIRQEDLEDQLTETIRVTIRVVDSDGSDAEDAAVRVWSISKNETGDEVREEVRPLDEGVWELRKKARYAYSIAVPDRDEAEGTFVPLVDGRTVTIVLPEDEEGSVEPAEHTEQEEPSGQMEQESVPSGKPDVKPVVKPAVKVLQLSGLKAKGGKKKITVSWKKTPGAAGYRIYYSTNKKMKKAKVRKVSAKTGKCTIYKLKKKKTYYVAVKPIVKKGSAYKVKRSAILRVKTGR